MMENKKGQFVIGGCASKCTYEGQVEILTW